MATGAPPDGWNVLSGTVWGSTSWIYNATNFSGIGPGGIAVYNGTIVSNWTPLDVTNSDATYIASCRAITQSLSNAATIKFVCYQSDKATVVASATKTLLSPTIAANYNVQGQVDLSQTFKPTTATPWGRWEISGSGSGLVSYVFMTCVERMRPSINAVGGTMSTGVSSAATFTDLPWTLSNQNEAILSTPYFVFRKTGNYLFNVNVQYTNSAGSFTAGDILQTRIVSYSGGSSGTTTAVSPPVALIVPVAGTRSPSISFSQIVYATSSATIGTNPTLGWYPSYKIQLSSNSAATVKTVPGGCSVSVALLN